MSRIASSRNTTESEMDQSTKSKVDRYAAKIVSLQSENIKLNNENQLLAQKFNSLTEYNQTLGNDLANFDEEIVFLEQQISQKTTEFKQLSKRADNLDKQIKSCRKTLLDDADFSKAANKLKKLEEKKIAVMKKLTELKGDSVNSDDPGILQTRALLLEEVKLLEQTNSDLMQEKALLQILIDTDKTVAQKKSTLEEMIKKKDKEQNKLLDEIQILRQSTPQELSKMLHMSIENGESQTVSEYADDEDVDHDTNKNVDANDQKNADEKVDNPKQTQKNEKENDSSTEKEKKTNDNESEKDDQSKKDDESLQKQQNSISESGKGENSEIKRKNKKHKNHTKDNEDDFSDYNDSETTETDKDKKKKKKSEKKSTNSDDSENEGDDTHKKRKRKHKKDDSDSDNSDTDTHRRRKRKHRDDKKHEKNDSNSDENDDDKKLNKSQSKKKKHHSSKQNKESNKDGENEYDSENNEYDENEDKENKKGKESKKDQEKYKKHHKRAASESRKGKQSSAKNDDIESALSDDQKKTSHRRKHSKSKNKGDKNDSNIKPSKNKNDDLDDDYDDYDYENTPDSARRQKHRSKRNHRRRKSPTTKIQNQKENQNQEETSNSTQAKQKKKNKTRNAASSSSAKANDKDAVNANTNEEDKKIKNDKIDHLSPQKIDQSNNQRQADQLPINQSSILVDSTTASSTAISAFASVRRKQKNPSAELVDVESQTNEDEISPILKGFGNEMSDREREALSKLDSLKKEIESKLQEKEELQTKLNKPKPKFTISDKLSVSLSPLPDAIHDLSLTLFSHHHKGSQTDISGETIDFHTKLLQNQVSEMSVASDLQEEIQNLQKQIASVNESINTAKQEGEAKDQQIKKVKEDLKKAKQNIESEQQNQDLETRMKNEIMNEIANLKVEIREKQGELESQTEKNQQMQQKLDELIKVRQSLERDIEDMTMREKPEIQTLSQQVHTYSGRVKEAEMKLKKAEEDLEVKREMLINLKKSEEMKNYKDLSIKKVKLERRLNKWKMLLKDSRETMQSLEAFSRQNFQKRQYLAQQLEKYEREKADKEEELRDLESYSALLNALILEQNENWS